MHCFPQTAAHKTLLGALFFTFRDSLYTSATRPCVLERVAARGSLVLLRRNDKVLDWLVRQQALDQVDVAHHHASAAVPRQPQVVQRLALAVLVLLCACVSKAGPSTTPTHLQQGQVLLPLVANHLATREAAATKSVSKKAEPHHATHRIGMIIETASKQSTAPLLVDENAWRNRENDEEGVGRCCDRGQWRPGAGLGGWRIGTCCPEQRVAAAVGVVGPGRDDVAQQEAEGVRSRAV
jgi:hypothetical protein